MYGSSRRKRREEYASMVRDKVEEATWKGLGVNDQWQQMKCLMMETAQDICGMTKSPWKHGDGMRRLLKQLRKRRLSTENGRKKTRKRQGRSIRRVDKMHRGLFLQQRERNRRNVQMT